MTDTTGAVVKSESEIGGGLTPKEAKKRRMEQMTAEERGYLRRKALMEAVWPFFRFVILFGLGFVILYPLIYMVSCTFRERSDMTDP
ncbi:MAG TPA: carbohydrate ABC transporter permease, partial [Ruminococcus sp.]|nr:carbohydrate ABC transporter permease [Ruminococcus sp.]